MNFRLHCALSIWQKASCRQSASKEEVKTSTTSARPPAKKVIIFAI